MVGHTTDADGEPNPLDTLFADDERPEAVNLEHVTAMPTDEFVGQLEAIAEAADRINTLAEDAAALRKSGLRDDDAKALIYGRNSSIRKSDINTVFDALDAVADGGTRGDDLLVTLVADVAGMGKRDTRDIMDELELLRERYAEVDE